MKLMDDQQWLANFAATQQKLADEYQSKAAEHQRASAAARRRIKQLKRGEQDGKQDQVEV